MNKIEKLRKDNNMSQKEFANYIKVSPGNLCDWEKGRSYPSIDKLIQIADLFNVTTDYLLDRDDTELNNSFFDKNEFAMLINYKKLSKDKKSLVNQLIIKLGE
mgnify:CR=1 FL=1